MKFGHVLRTTSEDLPDVSAIFEMYKQLKKQIKAIPDKDALHEGAAPAAGGDGAAAVGAPADALMPTAAGAGQGQPAQRLAADPAEESFVASLGSMLASMNDMWLEKEETCVIRVEALEGALAAAARDRRELAPLHQEFVDFHGEVLLLVHWSILAYTATVKLLKKHHKRTGLLLRAPLGNLLSQPFCSTEMMTDIAHRVEADIRTLCDRMHGAAPANGVAGPVETATAGGGAGTSAAELSARGAANRHPEAAAPGAARSSGLDLALLQRLSGVADLDSPTSSASERRGGNAGGDADGDQGAEGGRHEADVREADRHAQVEGEREQEQRQEAVVAGGQAAVEGEPPVERVVPLHQAPGLHRPHDTASGSGASGDSEDSGDSSGDAEAAERLGTGMGPPPAKRACFDGAPCRTAAAAVASGRCSILRQAQVALTTWEHLRTSASTPSTLMAMPASAHALTHTTESSAA